MPTGIWLYAFYFICVLIFVEYLVIILLARQVATLYSHWIKNDPDWGLPLGSIAPSLPKTDLYGRSTEIIHKDDELILIMFLSNTCHSCSTAIGQVHLLSQSQEIQVTLIVQAKELDAKLFVTKHRRDTSFPDVPIFADTDSRISASFKVVAVPFVVVVNSTGRIVGKRTVASLTETRLLVESSKRFSQQIRTTENTLKERRTVALCLNASYFSVFLLPFCC